MKALFLAIGFILGTNTIAQAQDPVSFNRYIVLAIKTVMEARKGGGYDISNSFTRNLSYGTETIKASGPPKTMCVAAVVETIVEAINIYSKEKGSSVYSKIPVTSWTKGNLTGLRANFFMFKDTRSRGAAYTLERFGMGKQLKFNALIPGDFINFNRASGSGHSVIFMGYLDKGANVLSAYSDKVAGFKYFSAQGKGRPDAGLGYRYAFFDGFCPDLSARGLARDCKVIRSDNSVLLNVGRMYDPSEWKYESSVALIKAGVRSGFESAFPGETKGFIDTLTTLELNRELDPVTEVPNYFDGESTD